MIDVTEKKHHYSSKPTEYAIQSDAPPPYAIGLPEKYKEFRSGQFEFIDAILQSPKRFTGLQLPTGTGKSLIYTGAALLSGKRSAMLTATKTLSDQLYRDMQSVGMVDIRGLNNYLCLALADGEFEDLSEPNKPWNMSCEDGPCMYGLKCSLKFGGCTYFDIVRAAQRSRLVSSNYSYFMHQVANEKQPLGSFDWLFLDEAHDAVDELTKFMTVKLSVQEVEGVIGEQWPNTENIDVWRAFATSAVVKLDSRYKSRQEHMQVSPSRGLMRELRTMKRLLYKLTRVSGAVGWIAYSLGKYEMGFSPIWPNHNAEGMLFNHIPHVVAVSATLTRKTLELMNIREEDCEYFESGSRFPVENWPLYWIPTGSIKNGTDPSVLRWWVNRMDQILDGRMDRKGIIHTTSYDYAHYILANSRHSDRMISHTREDTKKRVQEYKDSSSPLVLLSPSVGTGHDFAYDLCRFQIITKIPFPDTTDPLMVARCKDDKEFGMHVAAQKLVQMTGRGMRAEDDWCENFIIDDNWGWFKNRHRRMMPSWWLEGCKKLIVVPPAMRGMGG
jgi:ATP-dependent DNA helicase DinG